MGLGRRQRRACHSQWPGTRPAQGSSSTGKRESPDARSACGRVHGTGWRTPSEILPLEWRQVDMTAGEVRLDAGTTKNGEARTFPFTKELRQTLDAQKRVAE